MAHHYEVVDDMEQGVASIHPEESLSQVATGGKYLQCSHLSNVTSVIRSLGLSNMELRCNLFRLDLHSESTYSGIHKCFGAKNLCMLVKATEQGQSKIVVCGRRGGAADGGRDDDEHNAPPLVQFNSKWDQYTTNHKPLSLVNLSGRIGR
jgi:hypothetical protein